MKKALSLTLAGVMLAGALTGCGSTGSSSAQGGSDGASLDYPKNDVQIVIPYAPGGGSDNLVRGMMQATSALCRAITARTTATPS